MNLAFIRVRVCVDLVDIGTVLAPTTFVRGLATYGLFI